MPMTFPRWRERLPRTRSRPIPSSHTFSPLRRISSSSPVESFLDVIRRRSKPPPVPAKDVPPPPPPPPAPAPAASPPWAAHHVRSPTFPTALDVFGRSSCDTYAIEREILRDGQSKRQRTNSDLADTFLLYAALPAAIPRAL
ncbi:hypothetical protein ACQY0O_002562 [Thecaphora frezii]